MLGLFPEGLTGALLDLDATTAFPLGASLELAPRLGLSGMLHTGGDFFAARGGANAGLGLVARPSERMFVRLDGTARQFVNPRATIYSVTAGVGWTFGGADRE